MSIVDSLKSAGYVPEKSTVGDKQILEGVYKCMFVDYKNEPEGKFGPQIMAKFQIVEKLSGKDSWSSFPQFTDYYKTDDANVNSKRNGLAKLLNGFFSMGLNIDQSSDEALMSSLESLKGTAEVYIKGYVKEPMKNVGTKESPEWVKNEEGENRQAFSFMTLKNAEKEAAKEIKKAGHPL